MTGDQQRQDGRSGPEIADDERAVKRECVTSRILSKDGRNDLEGWRYRSGSAGD